MINDELPPRTPPPCQECRDYVANVGFAGKIERTETLELLRVLELYAVAAGHVHGGSAGRAYAARYRFAADVIDSLVPSDA